MALLARATGSVFFLSNNSYSKLISKCSKTKLYKKHSLRVLALNQHLCNIRFLHNQWKNKFVLYDEYIEHRRQEARRSILIEVQSERSCNAVYTHCSQFGQISGLFHYTSSGSNRHFVLIEYESIDSIKTVLNASTHINYDHIVPVQSLLLWFRNNPYQIEKQINNAETMRFQRHTCRILSNIDIIKMLTTANSVSHQMLMLYNKTRLNDVGTRLRFLTAYQIERCFQGFFPHIAVLPFGSSVNGFGKQNCDLDLCVILEKKKEESRSSRLIFQSKSILMFDRQEVKKLLHVIADTMHNFMPGILNIRKILEAKVPIIKFDHVLTGIECDLSMTNMTAYYMSELLYMFGEIDERVRPLIFTIRKWAQSIKLTSNNPGPWITNFSLSLMVLFFLQQKQILPDLNLLKINASKQDTRIVDTYVDCTFLRDINKIPKIGDSPNTATLEDLLVEFFSYYGNFDFESKAISLREGKPISKPDYSPMYICNPLETNLNVCKNINNEELEKIKIAVRSALWKMETMEEKTENWGLLNLLVQNTVYKNKFVRATVAHSKQNSVDIQALFEEDESISSSKQKSNYSRRQNKSKTKLP